PPFRDVDKTAATSRSQRDEYGPTSGFVTGTKRRLRRRRNVTGTIRRQVCAVAAAMRRCGDGDPVGQPRDGRDDRGVRARVVGGNAALLKHAPSTPRCALEIAQVWRKAGLPEGLLQSLLAEVDAVPRILSDPRVVAVTLTGSDRAGADVASRAGAALKRCVL